jgi:hypothetical protein
MAIMDQGGAAGRRIVVWLHRVEHAVVMILGFLVGAVLAMCVAPGDIVLVVVAGIVLGYFAHAFLDQNMGGELFWPFAKASGKNSRDQNQP